MQTRAKVKKNHCLDCGRPMEISITVQKIDANLLVQGQFIFSKIPGDMLGFIHVYLSARTYFYHGKYFYSLRIIVYTGDQGFTL